MLIAYDSWSHTMILLSVLIDPEKIDTESRFWQTFRNEAFRSDGQIYEISLRK
jgi:hypothetical protein